MFERLIQALLVDKTIDPKTLHDIDRGALLVASRIDTYGNEYEVEITCPVCANEYQHSFDLSNLLEQEIQEYTGDLPGVEKIDNSTFSVFLPKLKCKVVCKILERQDYQDLEEEGKKRKKLNLPENSATALLMKIVQEAPIPEGVPVSKWFEENLSLADSNAIKSAHEKLVPSFPMKEEVKCPSCESEEEYEIPITSGFFYPGRR
jgi:hypothetical protein